MASETGIGRKSEDENAKNVGEYEKRGGNVDVDDDVPNLIELEDVPKDSRTRPSRQDGEKVVEGSNQEGIWRYDES